jgi:heme/copper-type cytochrome/quinol oxidase subunit 2
MNYLFFSIIVTGISSVVICWSLLRQYTKMLDKAQYDNTIKAPTEDMYFKVNNTVLVISILSIVFIFILSIMLYYQDNNYKTLALIKKELQVEADKNAADKIIKDLKFKHNIQ